MAAWVAYRRPIGPTTDSKHPSEAIDVVEGTVVSFYSYKGGVGRSFALANVAAALAGWGYKVLGIDWDLEAPGLNNYFRAWTDTTQRGLLELLEDFRDHRLQDWRAYTTLAALPDWRQPIWLIPAGRQDDSYIDRLQTIDWSSLHEEHDFGFFIEQLRAEWIAEFDYIVIDSRTGITDFSGIVTAQLPDILVFLFTANEQSLQGVIDVVSRAIRTRKSLQWDRSALWTLPVPARFDAREERQRAMQWQHVFAERLGVFYRNWAVEGIDLGSLIEQTTIPYFPYWSFGEELPILVESGRGTENISYYFETLAALLAHKLGRTDLLVESRSAYVGAAARAGLRKGQYHYDVFISHPREEANTAKQLAAFLRTFSLRIRAYPDAAPHNDKTWQENLERVLALSQHLVALVGEKLGNWQERELSRFLRHTFEEESQRTVIPVLTKGSNSNVLPPGLRLSAVLSLEEEPIAIIGAKIAEAVYELRKDDSTAKADGFEAIADTFKDHDKLRDSEMMYLKCLHLNESLCAEGSVARVYEKLGTVYRDELRLMDAEATYSKSLSISERIDDKERVASVCGNLGRVCLRWGRFDEAELWYRRALGLHEQLHNQRGVAFAFGELGRVYSQKGDLARAREMYGKNLALNEELGNMLGIAFVYANLGNLHRSMGDLESAEDMYRRSLEVHEALGNEKYVAAAYRHLGAVALQRGDLDAYTRSQGKAVEIYKRVGDVRSRAVTLGEMARIRAARGQVNEALQLYREALASSPRNIEVQKGLAAILRDTGRFDEALQLYRDALASFPRDMELRRGLAAILRETGRLDEALQVYREALALLPRDVEARNGLATILREMGRLEEALQVYREALASFPDDVDARNGLAAILRETGGLDEAPEPDPHGS